MTAARTTTEIGITGFKQLDGVLGNRLAITAFVRQYAPHWSYITLTTYYDGLLERGGNAD